MSFNINESPSLDNIPTSGLPLMEYRESIDFVDSRRFVSDSVLKQNRMIERNRKQAKRIVMGRNKNISNLRALEDFRMIMCDSDAPQEDIDMVTSAIKALQLSASECVILKANDGATGIRLTMPSSHRLDEVGKVMKVNLIRKKLRKYFSDHPELFQRYDLMHLTVTVPHSKHGWRGNPNYVKEFHGMLNKLRKSDAWKKVEGSLKCTEMTRNENGLHIHDHELVFVRKGHGNRNRLYKDLLLEVNRLSIDESRENRWDPERLKSIRENTLRFITDEKEMESIISQLDPRGSTFVALETLYYVNGNGKKIRCKQGDMTSVMRGVLEVVKYSIKPMALTDESGKFSAENAVYMMKACRYQRLFEKTGIFRVRPGKDNTYAIRFNIEPTIEDLISAQLKGEKQVLHPDTGEPMEPGTYTYMLCKTEKIFVDEENGMKLKISSKNLVDHGYQSLTDFVEYFIRKRIGDRKANERDQKKEKMETFLQNNVFGLF